MATDKEIVHKELDLIQGVITRMASNSFEVKKWLIGILTAIVVFKHEELLGGNGELIALLFVPVICFWYLDAFFLKTERIYRNMYHWAVTYRSTSTNYLYDLNTMQRNNPDGSISKFMEKVTIRTNPGGTTSTITRKITIWSVAWSSTLWPFYIVPLIFILGYIIYSCIQNCHS